MELIEDGCSLPDTWADAIAQGLTSMHVSNTRIVATTNFTGTVARLTGRSSYTTDRGSGAVAAKTITGPNGSMVVLNYNELSSRSPADVQRVLAHEAGHIQIDSRSSEETSGNRDSTETDWQWWIKCLGAQAIVEFRIERSLADLGYPAAESSAPAAVNDSLLVTNMEVVNAVIDPASSDPRHLHDAILGTLNHVTKLLAYIAAPLVTDNASFSPSELSVEGQANWADYIAPTWSQRVAFWASIPPSTEPIPVESWRTTMREAFTLEQGFLLDFGFTFENAVGGSYGFYRKASDDVFTERLQRARAQADLLAD